MERVNGEPDNDHGAGDKQEGETERKREDESEIELTEDSSPLFYPSPAQNVDSDSAEIEASDSQTSDKQATLHTLTHTLELDTAGFESVEGHYNVPGPARPEEADTRKQEELTRPSFLPTVCSHIYLLLFLTSSLVSLATLQPVPIRYSALEKCSPA